jgi:hypothetical protein
MEVALRSSRTRTTVPSRISRAIGSLANAWAFHAPQSPFTLRYIRLTVPLPTPANRARSAWRNGAYWRRYKWPRSARWEASVRRSPQSSAVPFRRFAVPGVQPSARHVNLSLPEGPISVPGYRAEGAAIPAAALPRVPPPPVVAWETASGSPRIVFRGVDSRRRSNADDSRLSPRRPRHPRFPPTQRWDPKSKSVI